MAWSTRVLWRSLAYLPRRSSQLRWRTSLQRVRLVATQTKPILSIAVLSTAVFGLTLGSAASTLHAKAAGSTETATVDYRKVKEAINKLLDDDDSVAPTLVRLAWHTSGSYDKESNSGGSDGATMRFVLSVCSSLRRVLLYSNR